MKQIGPAVACTNIISIAAVHISVVVMQLCRTLDLPNLIHKFLFCNKFIICLYMFQAPCAHHQEVKIVLQSIWYHHTETSEWSKITKIQFYKYEHKAVKFMCEFFRCDYCILLTVNMLCHVEVMFIRMLNLLKRYCVYLHCIFFESI